MNRIAYLVGLLTLALLNATAQMASTAVANDIEIALSNQLKDQIVTLRVFYPEEELRFAADGHYKGQKEQGSWTLWSKIRVTSVAVTRAELAIQGLRIHVAYDAKHGKFINVESKEKAAIVIDFDNTPITLESAGSALGNIRLTKEQRLSTFVPVEWQDFLKLNEGAALQSLPDAELKEGKHEPFKIAHGITAPRALSAPDPGYQPEYQKEARNSKLQGTVVLWVVIDTDGRISEVRISRPLGMGLDEKAIEAVRKWQFEPAKKGGVPVRSQINIEVNLRLW